MENQKCVIIINQDLPTGIIANTAAVLSLSLGKLHPQLIGDDLIDSRNERRHGITTLAVPVLKSNGPRLSEVREALRALEGEITVIDLTTDTQSTRSYQEYAAKVRDTPVDQLQYQGVALLGSKQLVKSITGNMALLR